jgi:hypothetical protein
MTAQLHERVLIEGKQETLCTEPLAPFLKRLKRKPEFERVGSVLWRNYLGSWEIEDGRLYLIGLEATLIENNRRKPATLETLFPGYPDRVFAHWYSGRLRVPMGRLLKYRHAGFLSEWESDLFISVIKGHVYRMWTVVNGVAPPEEVEDDSESRIRAVLAYARDANGKGSQ